MGKLKVRNQRFLRKYKSKYIHEPVVQLGYEYEYFLYDETLKTILSSPNKLLNVLLL